jgi:hypothetical protein
MTSRFLFLRSMIVLSFVINIAFLYNNWILTRILCLVIFILFFTALVSYLISTSYLFNFRLNQEMIMAIFQRFLIIYNILFIHLNRIRIFRINVNVFITSFLNSRNLVCIWLKSFQKIIFTLKRLRIRKLILYSLFDFYVSILVQILFIIIYIWSLLFLFYLVHYSSVMIILENFHWLFH